MHSVELRPRSIVEPAQVQHAVQRVQQQLVGHARAVLAGAAAGFWDTDDDLAAGRAAARVQVEGEGEHVRRLADAHRAAVKVGHRLIVREHEGQIAKLRAGQKPVSRAQVTAKVRDKAVTELGNDREVERA
jgi:hypothetical protein